MYKRKNFEEWMIFGSIIALFILDLLSKAILTNKSFFDGSLIFIKYVENSGSSFGLFSSIPFYSQIIFVISFIVLALLVSSFRKFTNNKWLTFFFIFLVSGLLGNTYDRVIFGFVRDFIGLKFLFVFNLADLYITVAAVLLLIYEFRKK